MAPPFPSAEAPGLARQDALALPDSQVFPAGTNLTQPVTPPPLGVRQTFEEFMAAAHSDLDQGKFAEVHQTLSLWYDNPELSPEENRLLTDLLDQVAGSVIYSREHLLERPYVVKSGDTLERIARAYGVPWQLLAKINGIRQPDGLEPGRELKVVRGPFDAVIDLEEHELTLKLGGLYAGRFPIGVGRNQADLEGIYFVQDKILQSDAAASPLGQYWIKLDDRIGIHGTNDPQHVGRNDGPGTICLEQQHIEDVHDILSIGSRVQILR
jgi:lipoprotein-anchoring transpeptidase ErfK/SrfK